MSAGVFHEPVTLLLENGATVIHQEVPGAKTAGFAVLVPVGAVNEGEGQEGYTHFLEHLVFKGTPSRSAEDISKAISAVGGYLNAFTTKEYTVFYCHLPPEHLATGVEVVQDMLENATLKPKAFALEKNVVLEEIAMYKDDPQDAMFEAHMLQWHGGRGLGRPVLGYPEAIADSTPRTVTSYFQEHYHSRGLIMALAGRLEEKVFNKALKNLKRWRGPAEGKKAGFPRPKAPRTPVTHFEPSLYHRENLGASYLSLTLPSPGYGDKNRYAAMLLSRILGADSSSRLFIQIRERRGLCYDVGATTAFFREQGYFEIYATTSHKNLLEVLSRCQEEYEKLLAKGVNDEEVTRVKEQTRGAYLMGQEGTGNALNRLVSQHYLFGRQMTDQDYLKELKKQTVSSLNHFAKDVLGKEKPVLSVLTDKTCVKETEKGMSRLGLAPGLVAGLAAN